MSFTDYKWVRKTIDVFKQGLTPKELSLSITSAIIIGVIPFIGVSTAMIGFTALRFKLNLAVMVVVSYFIYPLQFALFVPFLKLGEWMFSMEGSGLNLDQMKAAFSEDILGALGSLWMANMSALVSWLILSVPAGLLMHLIIYQSLKIFMNEKPTTSVDRPQL